MLLIINDVDVDARAVRPYKVIGDDLLVFVVIGDELSAFVVIGYDLLAFVVIGDDLLVFVQSERGRFS